jgi:rhamnulose-1-phosphate aldolase
LKYFVKDIRSDLEALSRTALLLHRKGWDRGSSGNISLRTSYIKDRAPISSYTLDHRVEKELCSGELLIWLSRTGCSMEGLSRDPEGNVGLFRAKGKTLELLHGTGPPTSEVALHVLILSGARYNAIVHCHWDDIEEVSRKALKGVLPPWMAVTPFLPPGSVELAEETCGSARDHSLIVWPHHGLVSLGEDLDECIVTLDRAREHFDRH